MTNYKGTYYIRVGKEDLGITPKADVKVRGNKTSLTLELKGDTKAFEAFGGDGLAEILNQHLIEQAEKIKA